MVSPARRLLPYLRGVLPCSLLFICLPSWAAEKPFERWEKEVQALERRDRDHPPRPEGILFVGSSSIRLWNLPKSFPNREIVNHGFGGSQIADSTHFAPRLILPLRPRLIVFYAGDNDLAQGRSPEQCLADFKAFVQVVQAALPRTRIIFLAIKPSPQRWGLYEKQRQANALISEYCRGVQGLVFLDVAGPMLGTDGHPKPELFAKDKLHMNEAGYQVWATLLTPLLK